MAISGDITLGWLAIEIAGESSPHRRSRAIRGPPAVMAANCCKTDLLGDFTHDASNSAGLGSGRFAQPLFPNGFPSVRQQVQVLWWSGQGGSVCLRSKLRHIDTGTASLIEFLKDQDQPRGALLVGHVDLGSGR